MHIGTPPACDKVLHPLNGPGLDIPIMTARITPLLLLITMLATTGCNREIRTVDDTIRAGGSALEKSNLWQVSVVMHLTRPTHISEWEGLIYSDGERYAALFNGASRAGRLESRLVIDGAGKGWLRLTEDNTTEVLVFDPSRVVKTATGPEAFLLPGNWSAGNPLGMFLDPARALRILDATYDLRITRRTQVSGEPAIGFTGTIRPGALAAIDPEGYLAGHGLPINEVDITIRLLDGAPRRIQFMENGHGYWLIDYYDYVLDPDRAESRFAFDPGRVEVKEIKDADLETVAGVNDRHLLFEWDETQRALPRAN